MDKTVKETAQALGIAHDTVMIWCRTRRFPNAYLLYGSRKLGYRIPLSDVLDVAGEQREVVRGKLERAIA